MKKIIFLMILVLSMFQLGCTNSGDSEDNIIYIGNSETWLGTFTVSNIDSIYYNSLVIQSVFDEKTDSQKEIIGKIEYKLIGDDMTFESTFPQNLEGTGYFHVGSKTSAEVFDIEFKDSMKLTVIWNDKEETIDLMRLK